MTIWYVTTGRSLSERSRCSKPIDDEDLLAEIAVLDGRSDGDIRSQIDCGYDLLRRYALVRAVSCGLGEDRAAKWGRHGLVAGRFRGECWNGTRLRGSRPSWRRSSSCAAGLGWRRGGAARQRVERGRRVPRLGSAGEAPRRGPFAAPSVTITARPEYSLDRRARASSTKASAAYGPK